MFSAQFLKPFLVLEVFFQNFRFLTPYVAIVNTLRAGLQAIALAFAFKPCLPDGRYRRLLSIHTTLEPSEEKR